MTATDPSGFSERRQQQRVTMRPGAAALLVVDMLKDFCDPSGAMPLADADRLYPPIRALADAMRYTGQPVIWVADRHQPDDREFAKRATHCLAGTTGAEIVDELPVRPDDLVVPKRRYSAFFSTDLDLLLREREITCVVVTGVVTNICVRSTVHDAFFLGYDVLVCEDAVAATGPREQESSLWDIDTHFGEVTGHVDVIDRLRAAHTQASSAPVS